MYEPRKSRPGTAIRTRVGVVLDMFDSKYQGEMVRQLRLAAAQRFTDVVVFPGGWLATEMRGGALRRAVFDLVSAASVDGVILLSACLSRDVGILGVAQLCERFNALPVCTIGEPLEKYASLGVDNGEGMRAMVKHLIVDHGYRRIACIRGPLGNTDAEARHQTFCAELEAHGLSLDPSLLRVGDFITESGRAAMRELLSEPGLPFEAVVAANDYMALGALEVLSVRQGSLPNRVAVVGFDNIDEANFSSPPLTTVEQPFAELAAGAIRSILAQLQGERAPVHATFPTALVVRRSCGCSGDTLGERRAGLKLDTAMRVEQKFKLQQEALQAELSRASRGFFRGVKHWESALINGLVDDLRGIPGAHFLRATTRFLSSLENPEQEAWRFNDVLTTLRSRTLALLGEQAPERLVAEDLFQLARDAATHTVLRLQAENRIALEETWVALNDLGTALGECTDQASFASALDRELPRINVQQAFVSRYVPGQTGGSSTAQLVYAMDRSLGVCAADRAPFPAAQLFPDELARKVPNVGWVVLPLFFGQTSCGFAVVQLCADGGAFYEVLRIHLSVGLSRLP